MSLIEVMISLAVLGMMMVSVWSGFNGTLRGLESTEKIQKRYSIIRNGLSRMTSEISLAYLSFNRPLTDTKHYTLFEGRDEFNADSITFSSFAHLRMHKDANESDQSVVQYFVQQDPEDTHRSHLYRREANRLTGDRPEDMERYFPAYVLIEDVVEFNAQYWDVRREEWIDEWRTMMTDQQPDRLPERVRLEVGIREDDGEIVKFQTQAVLLMQERIDLGKT